MNILCYSTIICRFMGIGRYSGESRYTGAEGVRWNGHSANLSGKRTGHTYADVLLFGGLMIHQLLFLLSKTDIHLRVGGKTWKHYYKWLTQPTASYGT